MKKAIGLIVALAVAACAIGGFMYLNASTAVPEVIEHSNTIELNSEMTIADLPISINKGSLVNGETEVTTSTLGNNEVILMLENEYGFKSDHVYTYEVVDTTGPVLSNIGDMTVQVNTTKDLWDGIEVSDNSGVEVATSIEGEYSLNKAGEYAITFVAMDASGNETREEVILTVKQNYVPDLTHEYVWDDQEIYTDKGFLLKIENGIPSIDGVIIVNKTYSIPSTFGNGLTADTLAAFNTMRTDAAALGMTLKNSSDYRSYTYQKGLYNSYCARRGQTAADTFSARPGFSEHQLGMAIDLNSIAQSFKDTPEGKWVANNCHKYGFIIRYPEGKDHITGYIYEPWHIRYVGVDLATLLYNNGDWLTMEEYYGIDSVYPSDYATKEKPVVEPVIEPEEDVTDVEVSDDIDVEDQTQEDSVQEESNTDTQESDHNSDVAVNL